MIGLLQLALIVSAAGYSTGDALHPSPAESRRCSLVPPPPTSGYEPANLLTAKTVIVRARADSSSAGRGRSLFDGRSLVHFTILEVIDSGEFALPSRLAFAGQLSDKPDFNTGSVPYYRPRPEAQTGACFAYTYQRGGEFLLLLRGPSADSLTPYWAPLQPVNEQIRGASDPWVEWVRANRRAGVPVSLLVIVRTQDGRPIDRARVDESDSLRALRSTMLGNTDSLGHVLIRPIAAGCHRVVVRRIGFTPAIWHRMIKGGTTDTLIVVLLPMRSEGDLRSPEPRQIQAPLTAPTIPPITCELK